MELHIYLIFPPFFSSHFPGRIRAKLSFHFFTSFLDSTAQPPGWAVAFYKGPQNSEIFLSILLLPSGHGILSNIMVTERSLAYAVCTADYGGSPKSRGWQGPGTPVEPGHHPGPGPYPPGRHSRRRKNHSGSGFFQGPGPHLWAGPIHTGRSAFRRDRLFCLQQRDRRHDLPARGRVVQSGPSPPFWRPWRRGRSP